MNKNFRVLKIMALLLVAHGSTLAQTAAARPKIGVTLSGGGAKGFAHIGILRAIDSAGLKVDYITGTSMGSVVGGLYAAGYSGNQIESIARDLDWNILFSTAPQLSGIGIEEKYEYNKYALEVPFEKGKLKIGRGIIEGQELWLKFAELFYPVYDITDFSQLPIPFRCIGTDLSTGEAVVMGEGNIITSIRASMAIPAVFTPVRYNGKTLVDGGIVNNFPVMDVKRMGADFVIGVNLSEGLFKAEELKTSLDILLQLAFFKDADAFGQHKRNCDIYILPDLQGHSTGSFAAADSIIDIGKKYGRLYYPRFKKIADSLIAIYPEAAAVKERLPKTKSLHIRSYSVEGLKHTSPDFFFGLMGLEENTAFSPKKLAASIRAAYGSRYYKLINYDFITDVSGQTDLRFTVIENELTAVKSAINYNTFTKLSLIANMTARDLLLKESRALASVAISENPRFYAEYHKYLGKRRRFGFNMSYFREFIDYPVYEDFDLSETLRNSSYVTDFRVQYAFNQNSYAAVHHQFNSAKLRTIETPELTLKTKDHFFHSVASYEFNNVDKKYFTTKGWRIKAEAGYVYGQKIDYTLIEAGTTTSPDTTIFDPQDYARLFVKADHYQSISSKFSFIQHVTLGLMTSDNVFSTNEFQVGGIGENLLNQVTFYGLNEAEIKTGSIASAHLGLQYRIAKSIYLTGRANIALYNFREEGFDDLTASKNILTGYALTFGFDSAIGPIEVSTMYCDQDGSFRTNVNLGFRFLKQ